MDDDSEHVETSTKMTKVKKERTEKQKEASRKMMEALKEKRRKMAEQEVEDVKALEEFEKENKLRIAYEISKQRRAKKLPPVPNYVTTAQLELMERRIMAALPKEVYREVPLKTEVVEKVVPVDVIHTVTKEVVREKPTVVEKKITGNELLDRIFFK